MNSTPDTLFHFLTSLTEENEPCSDDLVSFFKELDTGKEPCSDNLIIMNKNSSLPRVPLLMEGKHLGSQDPMPPVHYARRHHH